MTVALPIDDTHTYRTHAYRRWPRFGDVIGHKEVERRYLYLAQYPGGAHHKVMVLSAAGVATVGEVVMVTDTNIGGAHILEEGPEA